jgi:hypothetical protein
VQSDIKAATRSTRAAMTATLSDSGTDPASEEGKRLIEEEVVRATAGASAELISFGIIYGQNRVVIYIEPDISKLNVVANTARSSLLVVNGDTSVSLPWADWAAEFRNNLPEEIQNFLDDNGYEDEEFEIVEMKSSKETIEILVNEMLDDAFNAIKKKVTKAINSGGLDVDSWDENVNKMILPKTIVIALLEDEAEQYKGKGTSFEKKVAKDVKNVPNNRLEQTMDQLAEEFESTKQNILGLSLYLDKVEELYNTILKEYQNRNAS